MVKQMFSVVVLFVSMVSCALANQSESSLTTPPINSPPTTSTPVPSPMVTAQFTPTPITLQTPSIPGDEPRLVFFISEQGKFQAWVPIAGDIVEYTTTRTLFGRSVECSVVGFSLNGASVTVQYCDLALEDIALLSDREILDEVRNVMKKELRLRIVAEQMKVIDGSYPELTLSGEEDSSGNVGTFKARIILAGQRVYFVHMYVYQIDWCYCRHQMDQVIDSFSIDLSMSIPFEPTPVP